VALLLAAMGCSAGPRDARLPLRAASEPGRFGVGGETLRYLVLGDSTAVGQGGDYEQGIAVEAARYLARGREAARADVRADRGPAGRVGRCAPSRACR
jgi:hypothetical protein